MTLVDRLSWSAGWSLGLALASVVQGADARLPGTELLAEGRDFSAEMVSEMSSYLDREISNSVGRRVERWRPDFSSGAAYEKSVEPNRARLARILGVVDTRVQDSEPEYVATVSRSSLLVDTGSFTAHAVRWPVLPGVYGEGLLLQPKEKVLARIVALPDADQAPEAIAGLVGGLSPHAQYARRLAESGCQVLVPVLMSRESTFSGSAALNIFTNQPHREWIYRQAYTFGRHIIGYEIQKVLAAVDWFQRQNSSAAVPIGVVGWGEGGLLAFYSSALDRRIDAAWVSGYFNQREKVWSEPIYRNVFGLLREFGDAEIGALIAPRTLVVDAAKFPEVAGPPPKRSGPGRTGFSAAPGSISQPALESVKAEVERAKRIAGQFAGAIHFVPPAAGELEKGLDVFLGKLGARLRTSQRNSAPITQLAAFDPAPRQRRQLEELERFTQHFIDTSREVREQEFWKKNPPGAADKWSAAIQPARDRLWNEVIGRLPVSAVPLNPRSRRIIEAKAWTGFEVALDVDSGQTVWGYLLLPNDLQPNERRPVIVAHHGGGGLPKDVIDPKTAYRGYGAKLADLGYVVFAPHFPFRAGDQYRELQRKANPLGLSVFSFILAHHERILDWLTTQPWADPQRIGLYGLSWGGKVAVRVPALLTRYALAIPSGDFNEWIWKNATTRYANSYMFVPEYEMFDFNLGMTFSYAEMAAMIAPRPFMVERGHRDGVGIDEWVAFEYAKVYRLYDTLQVEDRTQIEFFRGVHEIHGVGTFAFIRKHFGSPREKLAEGTR